MRKNLPSYLAVPAIIGLCVASPAVAQSLKFDIAEQDAAISIPAFAKSSNLQILAPAPLLRGIRTNKVNGSFDRRQALEMLIRGTGLKIAIWTDSVVTLARAGGNEAAGLSGAAADDQDIVVTGFLRSISLARDLKRKADTNKEVIVAEDMAKFPELNLAESLQRVPGVAINREAGEGRRITLRGLGPDFTRVQLNGMEVDLLP